MHLHWAGEDLSLSADRAAHWPRASALIVADLHLGKAAAYRALGVPVPDGGAERDLKRLSRLIDRTGSNWVIVLGDLLHARSARSEATLASLARWRAEHSSLRVTVVRGNHDLRAGDPPDELAFECVSPTVDASALGGAACRASRLRFGHEPPAGADSDDDRPTLCGHLHPKVSLEPIDGAGLGWSAPCFWFSRAVGVLPAFGSFTGDASIRPVRGDRVFAIGETEGEIVEVKPLGARGRRTINSQPGAGLPDR